MNRLSKILAVVACLVISIAVARSVFVSFAADSRAGVAIDPLNQGGNPTADQLAAAGVKWVRFVQKSDSFDYASVMRQYQARGIQTILVLNQETLWPPTGNGNFSSTYVTDFAAKARTLAQKYGGLVTAYEIWNEGDASSPASIYVPPDKYKALLGATYTAIKGVNSNAQVIVGGLVSGNTSYLDGLKESNGNIAADGVAVHPYSTSPDEIVATLKRYQQKVPNKRIWVTEFGWEISANNGQTQAKFLQDTYTKIYADSAFSSFPAVVWYSWSDTMNNGFGLLSRTGVAKPAMSAYLQYASKVASTQAEVAALLARIQLSSTRTPTSGGPTSKLGVFVHGSFNNEARAIVNARPKVLKMMFNYDGGGLNDILTEAENFKQANPNGITVFRMYDWPLGDLSTMGPQEAADKMFSEYSRFLSDPGVRARLKAFDYFETPNESERINHWRNEADVRWQNDFWTSLIKRNYNELGIKTCAASLTPGYLHPDHVPLLVGMFNALRETGGTLCYHSYADDDLSPTAPGENVFWYKQYYTHTEIQGVQVVISELGIADGWKKRGTQVMQQWLMQTDCILAQDPRVLGAAIYEVGGDANSEYSINDPVIANWLVAYLQNPAQYNTGCPVVLNPPGNGGGPNTPPPPGGPQDPVACSPAGEGTITVIGPSCGPSDPNNKIDASMHPDINIKLRGFNPENSSAQQLVDFRGSFGLDIDPKSPNVNELFAGGGYRPIVNSYRVGNWEADSWAEDPWLNATAFETTPNEPIYVPTSGYDIGCGYEVMVLYVDDNSVFIKYTREDNAVAGYGIHILGITPNPALKTLYDQMNAAGRSSLPGLKERQEIGRAIGSAVLVSYRDTGAFLDSRSCVDHWPGCPADGYPDTPKPKLTRDEVNRMFSQPGSPYNQRSADRADPSPACDVLSLENYPVYPPLGALQACPAEFPTVAEYNTPPTPPPPNTSGCSIAPIEEPAYCTNSVLACSDKNNERNGTICPNGIRENCYPESCTYLLEEGFTCGATQTGADGKCIDVNGRAGATNAQCGIYIKKVCDGEGFIAGQPPSDPSNFAIYESWQLAQSCYRGDGSIDYQSLAPNQKDWIGRCQAYYAKKGVSRTTPAPKVDTQLLNTKRLPSCVPTRSSSSDRCTSACGDPITLSERLGFSVSGNCATGQCKASIQLDPETPLFVPFARDLANYFAGVVDYGAVAEGVTTEEELKEMREAVINGDPESLKTLFDKSGVARKVLPPTIQDQLKCTFVNYIKRKDELWGTEQQENTRYIYLVDGVKTIFKIQDTPVTEIDPPPSMDSETCKYIGADNKALNDWSKTNSGKLWVDVPMFDNEESQGKIEFVAGGVFTTPANPIQTSIPEIRRLYSATNALQNALVPDRNLNMIGQPASVALAGSPTPYDLNLTIGPAIMPGTYLLACSPNPTPTLDQLYGDYDIQTPDSEKYALEPATPSYVLGVDCTQQGVPQDLSSTSKVCTVGPAGQLNCFQQLPAENNVITQEFEVVAQTRNVTPYLYDIFLQTIDRSGGLLRIFKPTYEEQNGTTLEAEDKFQKHFQPYPAESNRVKYELSTSQGVSLNSSENPAGWKLLFDRLGGVWTARNFVLELLQPKTETEGGDKGTPETDAGNK